MSRRRKGIERLDTVITVQCRCGLALGRVWRDAEAHLGTEAPRYHASRLEFRDVSPDDPVSGKIARKCPECGYDFQRRWVKMKALLDDLAKRDTRTFTLNT